MIEFCVTHFKECEDILATIRTIKIISLYQTNQYDQELLIEFAKVSHLPLDYLKNYDERVNRLQVGPLEMIRPFLKLEPGLMNQNFIKTMIMENLENFHRNGVNVMQTFSPYFHQRELTYLMNQIKFLCNE